ncbi:MAG: tyrosine-type recombinase/integrase [Candidatus Gracilibacteria bacterium]|jgi:site-specific recombinase XerD
MNDLANLHREFRRFCSLEEGLAGRTVKAMEMSFGTFLRRTGLKELNEVSEATLREFFYEGREKYQWSQSHYSNNHKYLKRFMGWCVQRGLRKDNPLEVIKRPKAAQPLPRRLTGEDARKILYGSFTLPWRYEFEQTRNHAIISTFLFTGLRMSELLNLELTDVDLKNRSILVRHGKGNKDRWVPIHYKLVRTLSQYSKTRLKATTPWFFPGKQGGKLTPKNLSKICKRIGQHTGVRFTCHQLRHTFGSVSVEQGLGIVQLKEIMGHSNLASTMIYLKMSAKSLEEGVNRLELF